MMSLNRPVIAGASLLISLTMIGCSARTDGPDVSFERGNLLRERGQLEDAVRAFDQAAQDERFAQSPLLLFARGNCYEQLGLPDKALADYAACLDADPNHIDARNQRGVVLAQQQRFEEAAAEFSALLEIAPEYALALRNRGLCYHDLGRYDEALASYDQALQQNVNDAETWFQRGNVHLQQGRLEAAESDFLQAIQRNDQHARAWMNLGVTRYQQGEVKQGMADLQTAQKLDSNIVLPDLDWAAHAPVTEVVMARPVMQPAADPWTECMAFVISRLEQSGVTQLSTVADAPAHHCAKLSGTFEGQPVTVYVAMTGSADARQVVLPGLDDQNSHSEKWLLLVRPTAAAHTSPEAEAPQPFEMVTEIRDWNPEPDQREPVLTRVRLP